MQIAELFVSLGVKGSDKTVSALANMKTGLGEVASTSLEVKAALVGALYAFQQLTSHSAQQGTALSNIGALTGWNVKQLQQWQYAAQQAGESTDEFTGSLKTVYDKMAQMKLNKGAPEGLSILAQTVGFDASKAYKDTFYVFEQLQKFAHSNVATDVQNQVLKSFGLSETTIAALRKGVFNATNFKRAPVYGDKEIDSLNRVDVLWKNLGQHIEMAFGHFTSRHGGQLVGDITKVVDQIFKLLEALDALAQKLEIFKKIANIFDGWAVLLKTITQLLNLIDPKDEKEKKKAEADLHKNPLIQGVLAPNKEAIANAELIQTQMKTDMMIFWKNLKEAIFPSFFPTFGLPEIPGKKDIEPTVPNSLQPNNNGKSQNVEINQNLYFQHEGKDFQKIESSVHKSVKDAWKQLSAQSQGS